MDRLYVVVEHAGNEPEKQLLDSDSTCRDGLVNSPELRVPVIEFSLKNKFTNRSSEYLDGIDPVSKLLSTSKYCSLEQLDRSDGRERVRRLWLRYSMLSEARAPNASGMLPVKRLENTCSSKRFRNRPS